MHTCMNKRLQQTKRSQKIFIMPDWDQDEPKGTFPQKDKVLEKCARIEVPLEKALDPTKSVSIEHLSIFFVSNEGPGSIQVMFPYQHQFLNLTLLYPFLSRLVQASLFSDWAHWHEFLFARHRGAFPSHVPSSAGSVGRRSPSLRPKN